MTQQSSATFEALKHRDFTLFVLGKFFVTLAINMLTTGVAWQVYEFTHDTLSLGIIGLAEIIPFVLVTLLGGYIADIIDRRKILIISILSYVGCALALAWLSGTFYAHIQGHATPLPIYGVIVCTGIIRGFMAPAQSALMAQLVPKDLYAASSTWNNIAWHSGAIGGPALAGLVYARADATIVYSLAAIFAVLGGIFFILLKSYFHQQPNIERGNIVQSLQQGLRFVMGHQIILAALSLDMFAVFFGGAVAILPAFADQVLHVGKEGLGWLRTAPAIGSLIMAVILVYFPPIHNAGKKLLLSIIGFGIATIVFAFSTNYTLSLLALGFTGFFDNISVVLRGAILQIYTPDAMRGRVSAVNSIFVGSSNELGAFESGVAARFLGLVQSVVLGGSMVILVVILTAIKAPKLRKLEL
jgi:MFS family permease